MSISLRGPDEGYLNAIDQAIHNDDYAAVSISYGLDEDHARLPPQLPDGQSLNKNVDEGIPRCRRAWAFLFSSPPAIRARAVCAATFPTDRKSPFFPKPPTPDIPSTSPYATAVGGTMLYAKNGAISEEIVWNELGPLQQNQFYFGGATGGGVSDRYKTVPSYQSERRHQTCVRKHPVVNGPRRSRRCRQRRFHNRLPGKSAAQLQASQSPRSVAPVPPLPCGPH